MGYVNVYVDLDEFDLDELLEEIKERYEKSGIRGKSNRDKIDLFLKTMNIDLFLKTMNIDPDQVLQTGGLSLIDQMKVDFLFRNISKIKLENLENLV